MANHSGAVTSRGLRTLKKTGAQSCQPGNAGHPHSCQTRKHAATISCAYDPSSGRVSRCLHQWLATGSSSYARATPPPVEKISFRPHSMSVLAEFPFGLLNGFQPGIECRYTKNQVRQCNLTSNTTIRSEEDIWELNFTNHSRVGSRSSLLTTACFLMKNQ